ncbi:MAG: nucleotidyl transferase AbiEii/AbiGii toxin family protein [Candidatus Freyarchaeota archaeon]
MLTMDDIRRHAFKRRLKNMELVRLDYLQDVILFILYTQISPGILFKGGTATWKLMKGERFSEDLDLEFDKKLFLEGSSPSTSCYGGLTWVL